MRSLSPATAATAIRALGAIAVIAFVLLVHNYGISLLPDRTFAVPAAEIKPLGVESPLAYQWEFTAARGGDGLNPQSRASFAEEGRAYPYRLRNDRAIRQLGGARWSHERTRIVFSTPDNTDPRTNGRRYTLSAPMLYTPAVGRLAAAAFGLSLLGFYFLARSQTAPATPRAAPNSRLAWRWPELLAVAIFFLGLYCNTGTLAPYANTNFAVVDKTTGYLYNGDHPHFRVLFDFVDGADRPVWDKALLLRRVLFPVLAWPFIKLGGFEIGGVVASLIFQLVAFVLSVEFIGRRVGARGARLAAWLLALYPGAAYWAGLPYTYALIFPASMLLALGLASLPEAAWKKLTWLSLLMGVAYLGYDLHPIFVPASFLVLVSRRRFGAALLSSALQLVPLAIWTLMLSRVFQQPLENSNAGMYRVILTSFLKIHDLGAWWTSVSNVDEVGLDVFFGANFIFLPALFLVVVALNPFTSRIRFQPLELSLLGVTAGLFLFCHLAPHYDAAWDFRGTWIARIYQPVFPAFIFFLARWWQELPSLRAPTRVAIGAACAVAMLGNALVIFGPILNNPGRISEFAFYRFYNHTDLHWLYEQQLKTYGRRPLGFPRPMP